MLLIALPQCVSSVSKFLVDNVGLLKMCAGYAKLWMMQALLGVGHLHANNVAHTDLHMGNFLIVSVGEELQLVVADLGSSIDFSNKAQEELQDRSFSMAKTEDLRSMDRLLSQMLHGVDFLEGKAMAKVKADANDEYALHMTLSDCGLKAGEVLLLNFFQGPKKARQHPQWALDIATKDDDGNIDWTAQPHTLLAHVNKETLKERLSRGGCMLRLSGNGVSKEGGIPVKAHVQGELEACLYPSGFVCPLDGGDKDCPIYGLRTREQFAKHMHAKETGGKVKDLKEEEKITVPKQHELDYHVVSQTTGHGDPNLVYSRKIVRCAPHMQWADVIVYNVHGKQVFAHKCENKTDAHWMKADDAKVLLVEKPEHLGEIVESTRSDWADPWTNLHQLLRQPCYVKDHPLAKRFRDNGIEWTEPTLEAVKKALKAAKEETAQEQPSTSKGARGGRGAAAGGKKPLEDELKGLDIGGKGASSKKGRGK